MSARIRRVLPLLCALIVLGFANLGFPGPAGANDGSVPAGAVSAPGAPSVGAYLDGQGRLDFEALRRSGYEGPVDVAKSGLHFDPTTGEMISAPDLKESQRAEGDQYWAEGFGNSNPRPGVDGYVQTMFVYQGALIVGGGFYTAGGIEARNIARWDGTHWSSLGTGLSGSVLALGTYGGDLIAGGSFSSTGRLETWVPYVARWDGSAWLPLGSGLNSTVRSLSVYNGLLIAGGDFSTAGGVPAANIAAWDGSVWSPLASGLENGPVYALHVHGGALYAGGHFDRSGPVMLNSIARWDGTQWQALGSGVNSGGGRGEVHALTTFGTDLIVGGCFNTAGGVETYSTARWDGTTWYSFGFPYSAYCVEALFSFGDGIFAGSLGGIQRWDGTAWTDVAGAFNGDVRTLAELDGQLLAGGQFLSVDGLEVQNIAAWQDPAWAPLIEPAGNGLDRDAFAVAPYGADLAVGGRFYTAGPQAASQIALWDGAAWDSLGTGANAYINALVVYQGKLIAGGGFTMAGGVPCNRIAAWDGTAWTPLGDGLNTVVTSLAVYGSDLIAGGHFTTAGGAPAAYIARWDGASWHAMGSGMNDRVLALTVYQDRLVAGGYFTEAGGAAMTQHLASWDGFQWHDIVSGEVLYYESNEYVAALAVFHDELIVGGSFYGYIGSYSGSHFGSMLRWDGIAWHRLASAGGQPVRALTVHNGWLIVGGEFNEIYDAEYSWVQANFIARWSGLQWSPLGSGLNNICLGLSSYGNDLYAVGYFSNAGGKSSVNIARWNDPTPNTICAEVGIPTGLQPPAGASLPAESTVTTSCQAVSLATLYDWQLFANAFCDGNPSVTATTATESTDWIALPVGTYGWRVRAINNGNPPACSPADTSDWSPCSWFTLPHPNAAHCDFVATGLPYIVVIDNASKDGGALDHGDVVGLFATYQDRWICVGSAPYQGSWPLSVPAMEADPGHGLPGFVPGDPIVIELCASAGDSLVGTPYWRQNGTYGVAPYSAASYVEFRSPWCHREIPLQANRWEWIGLGLHPADPNAATVFGGLGWNLIIAMDDEGLVYIPGQVNTLSPLGVENGYRVFLGDSPATLEVTGSLPSLEQDCIPIASNRWNLIPYLTDSCGVACALDIGQAMGAWADSIIIVQNDDGNVWIPERSIDTIGMLDPRLGYYLFPRATTSFDLCYPSCLHGVERTAAGPGAGFPALGGTGAMAAKPPASPEQPSFYSVQATGMPEIVLVTETNVGLVSDGDEIAVLCEGRVVGAVRFQGSWPLAVPVWRGSAEMGLTGFTPGAPMTAELWDQGTGRQVALLPVTEAGQSATFRFEPYVRVRLQESATPATGDPAILWARPNPSRDVVEIACRLSRVGDIPELEIYDSAGRLVRRLTGAPREGVLRATWDGTTEAGSRVASGVYFLRLKSGAKGSEQRLLILR